MTGPDERSEPEAGMFTDFLKAHNEGKIWLNSVPVVIELIHELHAKAWHATLAAWKGEITESKAEYIVSAEISRLVQIFEGRNDDYAVLPWNLDPEQQKKYIIRHYFDEDGNADPDDLPTAEDCLPRFLDCAAHAAIYAVESLLPDCLPMFKAESKEAALKELMESRDYHAAMLLGMPNDDLFKSLIPD